LNVHYLIELDKALFLSLNTASWLQADVFWIFMSSRLAWLLYCIPAAALLGYALRQRFATYLLWFLLLFLITDQSANFFKNTIQRPRPCREPELLAEMNFINGKCSQYGYFSGHSANSMALVVFTSLSLCAVYPRHKAWIWAGGLLFTLLVSFSRIMVGVHYPFDVLSGWTWGALTGLFLYRAVQWIYRLLKSRKAGAA